MMKRILTALGSCMVISVCVLAADGTASAPDDEAFRIVALGDSVTVGVRRGVDPNETFVARLESALKAEFPRLKIINAGMPGNTTRGAGARIYTDVIERRPGICTLMYGINDSFVDDKKTAPRIPKEEFEGRLRAIIRLLRYNAIEPVVLTTNPMTSALADAKRAPYAGEPKGMNFLLEQYNDITREIAKQENVPLVDVYAEFWKAGGNEEGLNKLLTDGMHPNPEGHKLIASLVEPVLRQLLSGRSQRPLPTAQAAENLRKAEERLANMQTWNMVCSYRPETLPNESEPRWIPSNKEKVSQVARVEGGELRLAQEDAKAGALSFTLPLGTRKGDMFVEYTARVSANTQAAPYLSIANGQTKVWTWPGPKSFVFGRYDRNKDCVAIPLDGTVQHTYKIVISGYDLYAFVDDMGKPAKILAGWVLPYAEGSHVQFAVGTEAKPCEFFLKSLRVGLRDQ